MSQAVNQKTASGIDEVYNAKTYGLACDGSTDDTAAFNALLATVYAAGGGTIFIPSTARINGQVLMPNDGAVPPTQPFIRITGIGSSANGRWGTLPAPPSSLDLRYAAGPKLDTRGSGLLEIDHIALVDGGADSQPFVFTTNTTLHVHDCVFSGTATGINAVNDAIVCGGDTTTINGSATSPFQGYGTIIRNNFFDKIRRGVWCRVYCNGISIRENTWSTSCGSNLTTVISTCTNAAAVVCTSVGHGMNVGTTYSMTVSGATGSWVPINGEHVVTPLSVDTFSLPVDSTLFGALTGSPVYRSGGAIEFDGSGGGGAPGNYCVGNIVSGNLVEMNGYACFALVSFGEANAFTDNTLFDPTGTVISYYRFFSGLYNQIKHPWGVPSTALIAVDASSDGNSYLTTQQAQNSEWTQPMTFGSKVSITSLSAYANNAAALVGGLLSGDLYIVTGSDPRQVAVVF